MTRAVYVALSAGLAVIGIGDHRLIRSLVKTEDIHRTNGAALPASNAFVQIVSYNAHGFISVLYSVRPNALASPGYLTR